MTKDQPTQHRWAVAMLVVGILLTLEAIWLTRPMEPPAVLAVIGGIWLALQKRRNRITPPQHH